MAVIKRQTKPKLKNKETQFLLKKNISAHADKIYPWKKIQAKG